LCIPYNQYSLLKKLNTIIMDLLCSCIITKILIENIDNA
jgi:hypothetical protein